MEKIKKILLGVAVVAFVAVFALWMFSSDLEHIEDTNGADNYNLQQISDYNIIAMDMGALNFKEKTTPITLKEYYSNKFTGVAEVYKTNIVANRFDITVYNSTVDAGNLRIVLVYNDEIVHEFKLNELTQSFTLKDVKGTVSLRVAGESADFSFSYNLV